MSHDPQLATGFGRTIELMGGDRNEFDGQDIGQDSGQDDGDGP